MICAQRTFGFVMMLTEVCVGSGRSANARTVATPTSSSSFCEPFRIQRFISARSRGDREGTYGVDGSDFLVPRKIPPKDLRANIVRLISARFVRQLTFVPNLASSFDAPTTAYLGEDRKVFLIGSNSAM